MKKEFFFSFFVFRAQGTERVGRETLEEVGTSINLAKKKI